MPEKVRVSPAPTLSYPQAVLSTGGDQAALVLVPEEEVEDEPLDDFEAEEESDDELEEDDEVEDDEEADDDSALAGTEPLPDDRLSLR